MEAIRKQDEQVTFPAKCSQQAVTAVYAGAHQWEFRQTPGDGDQLTALLADPSDIWRHGVTLIGDLQPSCSLCDADPDTELLTCGGCGNRYHLYCVEENNVPCSLQAQLAWLCRQCRAEHVDYPQSDPPDMTAEINVPPSETAIEEWPYAACPPPPPAAQPVPVTCPTPRTSSPSVLRPLDPLACFWHCSGTPPLLVSFRRADQPQTKLTTPETSLGQPAPTPEANLGHVAPTPVTSLGPPALTPEASLGQAAPTPVTSLGQTVPTPEASGTLRFTLQELMNSGGDQPGGPSTSIQVGGQVKIDCDLPFQLTGVKPGDDDQFKGFVKCEELASGDDKCSRYDQRGPKAPRNTHNRRWRDRKYPTVNASYNLRRSSNMKRISYRQTRIHKTKRVQSPSENDSVSNTLSPARQGGAPGQTSPASQLAEAWEKPNASEPVGAEEAPPAFYTVPLQYQLLDTATALQLCNPSGPELSGDLLEETSLGFRVVPNCGPDQDLLQRLGLTVQQELDRLAYPPATTPPPRPPFSHLRAPLLKGMLEEEWHAWRRLMPPRRGRPRKYPRPDDLSWITQVKQLGVQVWPRSCVTCNAAVILLGWRLCHTGWRRRVSRGHRHGVTASRGRSVTVSRGSGAKPPLGRDWSRRPRSGYPRLRRASAAGQKGSFSGCPPL